MEDNADRKLDKFERDKLFAEIDIRILDILIFTENVLLTTTDHEIKPQILKIFESGVEIRTALDQLKESI